MLDKEVIALCTENHTEGIINTLYGKTAELLNIKEGVTFSYLCALKN